MSNQLNLEPRAVFAHFEALAAIPRPSGKEAAARDYVLSVAAKHKLEVVQDGVGNVVVRKPARPGRESAPMTALQSHLDMVCEKNEGTAHNFDTDPIRLVVDGDWLKADGTTLGADNGFGVAASLAVMESTDIQHGPLEFVFTVDEETGLTGASEFPNGLLQSKYFLNLDGEEEGTLCIGCAGGLNTLARRKITMYPATAGSAWRIKVAGLQGGHSGIDIHRGRGNALRILGHTLHRLAPIEIADVQGGNKRNAIPREASAILLSNNKPDTAAIEADIRADLGSFEPEVRITVEPADKPAQVLSPSDAQALVNILVGQHHGVIAMSPAVPGLVQTSTNLATVTLSSGEIILETSQRSAIESSKQAAGAMVVTVFRIAGFETEHNGGYPGWKPEPNSDIVRLAQAVHNDVLGHTPELVAMHAGLECGVIGEKHPGMQMVSFGPHIVDVHSPSEKIKISSVAPFYRFLSALLERV